MRKLRRVLILLTITTFTGTNISNILANNWYEKQNQKITQFNKIKNQTALDYNWDFNKTTINLGFIKEANTETILMTLREQYPTVNFDEFNVEISGNSYCNNFSDDLCANLKVKENSLNYPAGLKQTIIFNIMPSQNHDLEKRNSPPSMLALLTTIDIGTMEFYGQDDILERLRSLNHYIFSRPDFLANFEFNRISRTGATGHLRQNLRVGEGINDIIPDTLIFTINFTFVRTLSPYIPNRNLGQLANNYAYTILERLQELNDRIVLLDLRLRISQITQNSALIHIVNASLPNNDETFQVNFYTNNFTLSSLVTNYNLGELPNNEQETIKAAFLRLNQNVRESDIKDIFEITMDSAVITGTLPLIFGSVIWHGKNMWFPNPNNIYHVENFNPNSRYPFCNSIMVFFTLPQKQLNNENSDKEEKDFNKLAAMTGKNAEINDNSAEKWITPRNNIINIEDLILRMNLKNNDVAQQYYALPIIEKQKILAAIKQHFQTLPADEQRTFQAQLKALGITALKTGINIDDAKLTVSANPPKQINNNEKDPSVIAGTLISGTGFLAVSTLTGVTPITSLVTLTNAAKNAFAVGRVGTTVGTSEAVELAPLLSTSATEGIAATETVTTVAATEGTVLGAEVTTGVALGPETLGLSLVIAALAIIGTGLFYWIGGFDKTTAVKHESHNQYNEIEKYYQFLAHDKLKLDLDAVKWQKIKQIYQNNSNNYVAFLNEVQTEIISFHKEDHSGWGGTISNNDIDILIKILFNHFSEIDNSFVVNSIHGWKIVTNTIGSYFAIEEE